MFFLSFFFLTAHATSNSDEVRLAAPLSCDPDGPRYSVTLGSNTTVFSNSPPLRVHVDNADVTSFVLYSGRDVAGEDTLGTYQGTECQYAAAASPSSPLFTASAYTYSSAPSMVRFHYSFPHGALGTNQSSQGSKSTIANFPGFSSSSPTFSNVITWHGSFMKASTSLADAFGMTGGPVVFYGYDVSSHAVLLSPLDGFLTSALAAGSSPGAWAAGVSSTVTRIPPNFAQSWIMVSDAGITPTVNAWGNVMRSYYAATSVRMNDLSLTTLGYQTDNGAQLCFGCPGQVLDTCLLNEKSTLDAAKVPIQYLSFQNAWWTSNGESAPWCVGEWVANPKKVPMGMKAFQTAVGLPLQLYAPYFCNTSSYPSNFTMVRSDTSLPGCNGFDFYDAAPNESLAFYGFLLDLGASYGATMFEPDFLNQNHNCVRPFIENIGDADAFFSGQAQAALARGIPIQWCFCTPYLALWTLREPAITNFRVSKDFFYGASWDIGVSSLLLWATGASPSKDTFWTSDNGKQATTRGGCDKSGCPPDHSTPAAVLHTMLALFSTGPVGFSDAPNETDVTLLMRTCDANGNLLQPSRPIIAVDSTHDTTAGAAPKGYVLATHTLLMGVPAMRFVLSHQLQAPFQLRGVDIWPRLIPGTRHALIANWTSFVLQCTNDTTMSQCGVTMLDAPATVSSPIATLPPADPSYDKFSPLLTLLAPTLTSCGMTFLGEVDKFAVVSVQRFAFVGCEESVITFGMSGSTAETVRVAFIAGGTVFFGLYTFPSRSQVRCTAGLVGLFACAP